MAFGPDGSIYLTTEPFCASRDGWNRTRLRDLTVPTSRQADGCFGGAYGSLAGLSVDSGGNVLLQMPEPGVAENYERGKVDVVLRVNPLTFEWSVATTAGRCLRLEVGFTLPNISSGHAFGSSVLMARV